MPETITEWEFTADVASWINEILGKDPSLPFSRAKCEQRGSGSKKRRDLTLIDKNKIIILTGEVKLPYRKDGSTPYNENLVQDARKKAQKAKTKFFFTWNVNEFVLWETFPSKTAQKDRRYESWKVVDPVVHKPFHLSMSSTSTNIQLWIATFLNKFVQILRGKLKIGILPPDRKFINSIESALNIPIMLTFEKLEELYETTSFRNSLDRWMREEQGWIIYDDPEGIRDNLERTSKFACYALLNKLVFHEALLKRYGAKLGKITVPQHIDTAEDLRLHLEKYFEDAKKVTGDYETVFGEDHFDIGNRIPLYSDAAVSHWRELINQIHEFDFSKIDYEIIGNIFEGLISPEERHKYGQFYTRPEVVDLINSFCIHTGSELVMDPACGGGTFLVRAYARKRELNPSRKHSELISDLYGIDISHFATHLTTINLATRDLIDDENYPQIARSDFFDVGSEKAFLTLPKHIKVKGLSKIEHVNIEIPPLDCVIGNPPYIRQEDIPKGKKTKKGVPKRGTKEFYQSLIKKEARVTLSGRSDIHCYFWPHATTLLREKGYLCLLTSSQWLDVEYGFKLQEWILNNFEIIAIFESIDEPWFIGARVVTAVTILRRQINATYRENNDIRFVQLRKPISEILEHDGSTVGAVKASDDFRDTILGIEHNIANDLYRVRIVKQGELWNEGVRLGYDGNYFGGKWGVYLRAPDLWFEIIDKYGKNISPLSEIAKIKRGVTSGKDSFFFPIDVSTECLQQYSEPHEFNSLFGVSRKKVELQEIMLVKCGDGRGEIKPIEAKFLEPEVHSLMEVSEITVSPKDCSRQIFLVDKKKSELKNTYAIKYIEWGEKRGVHKGTTCLARQSDNRKWYDLTGQRRGQIFWPKSQQYKHLIPLNESNLICNCNLYNIYPRKDVDPIVFAGILNSTIVALSKYQYGRPVGVEGNLKTEVIDVNLMLVPDPTKTSTKSYMKITKAFEKMKKRKVHQFLSERRMREMAYKQSGREHELDKLSNTCELDMKDRQELDDAVLELIGVKSSKERKRIISELYSYFHDYFERTRQKEEKAIKNKKVAKRRGPARPNEVALQIYNEIAEKEGYLLKAYDPDFIDLNREFNTFDIPSDGVAEVIESDMFTPHGVKFKKGKKIISVIETKNQIQDNLIILLARSGVRGLTRIPHDEDEVNRIYRQYDKFLRVRENRIKDLIAQRTSDDDLQERIYESIIPLLLHKSPR